MPARRAASPTSPIITCRAWSAAPAPTFSRGPSSDTTWNVTGTGSGTVAGTSFGNFERLVGAADNQDTFVFAQGAAMAGGVDGGAGGFDTLITQGTYQSVGMTATDGSSGTVTLDGTTIAYAGLEPITLAAAPTITLDLTALGDTASLSAGSAGTMVLSTANHTAETTTFSVPSTSLTINLHGGSGSTDSLVVHSVDPSFHGKLTIDSNDGGATGSVELASSLTTNGNAVAVTANTITVDGGVTVNTELATGDAGDISFTGRTITLVSGSDLEAAASGTHNAGTVALTASDTSYRIFDLPIDYVSKSVGISLDGATINAGDVNILATASDVSLASEFASYAAGYGGGITSTLSGLLAQLPGAAISAFTGLDASVILRGGDAKITVNNSTISSSGSVDIESTTDIETSVTATAFDSITSPGYEVAVGYAQATSTVTTLVSGTSSITAANDVTVAVTGTTTTSTTATATVNANASRQANPNATAFAVALGHTQLDAETEIDDGVTITATAGSVNVTATATDGIANSASTTGAVDAKAGVSVSLGFDSATVKATLNGHITAGGAVASTTTFNGASAVNTTTDTINIPNHGLTTGDQVVYSVGAGGTPIGGLTDGTTYSVIVVDANNIELADRPSLALDPTVTDPTATQTLAVPSADQFSLDAIDPSADTIRLIDHGFNDGDTVTYHAQGNTPIQGLVDGASYKVQVVDSTMFKLLDAGTGQVEAISQGAALGQQSFSDVQTGTTASITLASIDASTHAIDLPSHGLTEGQTVYYATMEADGTGTVGGLQNEKAYTVHVLSPNAVQLIDPSTGLVVALTDPGAASRQELGYVGQTFSFNPSSAVDGSQGTIDLPSNRLQTGDALIYRVDPTKSHTVIVPEQDANGVSGTLTATAADQPIGGLQNNQIYYVVRVDADHIRLADSPADALAALPIDLTGGGSGSAQSLAANPLSGGINDTASLTASDTGSASPTTGGDAPQVSDLANGSSISLESIFNGASALKAMASGPTDQNGNNINDGVKNDGLSGAGGIVVNIVNHTADAFVGDQATAAAPTVLSTPANITVTSTISQGTQISAQSSVTKPDDSKGTAVSLSIGVGVYSNDAEATIFSNAKVDAGTALTLSSDVEYPMLADPAVLYSPAGIEQNFQNNGVSGISSYLDGTLGVASNLLNTWVVSAAGAGDSEATAVSGSIAINVFTNTSHATIQSGAQINQDPAVQTVSQAVSVTATTAMTMLDVAGIGQFNLNPGSLFDAGKSIKSGEKGPGRRRQRRRPDRSRRALGLEVAGRFDPGDLADRRHAGGDRRRGAGAYRHRRRRGPDHGRRGEYLPRPNRAVGRRPKWRQRHAGIRRQRPRLSPAQQHLRRDRCGRGHHRRRSGLDHGAYRRHANRHRGLAGPQPRRHDRHRHVGGGRRHRAQHRGVHRRRPDRQSRHDADRQHGPDGRQRHALGQDRRLHPRHRDRRHRQHPAETRRDHAGAGRNAAGIRRRPARRLVAAQPVRRGRRDARRRRRGGRRVDQERHRHRRRRGRQRHQRHHAGLYQHHRHGVGRHTRGQRDQQRDRGHRDRRHRGRAQGTDRRHRCQGLRRGVRPQSVDRGDPRLHRRHCYRQHRVGCVGHRPDIGGRDALGRARQLQRGDRGGHDAQR
ncbi:MAG: hypothetical protein WDO24_04695 [Pseudomonadota bacterium]